MSEKGLLFLLKLGAATIAGMRSTGLVINGEEVDVTTKDSAGWRELLAGAGTTSFTLTASGVFQDNSNVQTLQASVIAKTLSTYSIVFESGDDYTGSFQCTNVQIDGEHNGETTYSVTLESSGVVSLTTV